MAVEDSVAQDQLRAFIERIERMEEEKAGIVSDIKEIYAEAKGNGFDTKILRKIVAIRKQDANERMEQEAILDLYMGALGMVAAPTADYDDEPVRNTGPMANSAARLDAWAEQVADRIDPQLLLTIIEASKTEAGRKLVMNAIEAVKANEVVSTAHIENTEPQPTKAAGSDLAIHPALNGQVADNPDIANPISNEAPMAVDGDSAEDATAPLSESVDILPGGEMDEELDGADHPPAATFPDADKSVEAPASAAPARPYAAPGVVTWESAPPEGVIHHPYSKAFGTLGQDIAVIEDDLRNLAAEPIVKVGNMIIDGWARFNKARGMFTEELRDGVVVRVPIEYQVVQYAGTDPLMDVIRWNMNGRILNESQRRQIAKNLVGIESHRKADIFKALDMGMELVS